MQLLCCILDKTAEEYFVIPAKAAIHRLYSRVTGSPPQPALDLIGGEDDKLTVL